MNWQTMILGDYCVNNPNDEMILSKLVSIIFKTVKSDLPLANDHSFCYLEFGLDLITRPLCSIVCYRIGYPPKKKSEERKKLKLISLSD